MSNPTRPILVAGPTASGKSALALRLAAACNGCIINADALQVYDCWHLLSARPSEQETAQAPHHLYGHIGKYTPYSTGHWLRDVADALKNARQTGHRPIIIGGTGLYFSALVQGLAEIPPIPDPIRAEGNARRETHGKDGFLADLAREDPQTLQGLDQNNPARLQRAWEVLRATGKGLAQWQANTPPPLVPPATADKILLTPDRDWLADRIARRFDQMMTQGALDEVRAYIADGWNPTLPSAQAIGARELVAHLQGTLSLDQATEQAIVQTRQYAKRQRTWFRGRMKDWQPQDPAYPIGDKEFHKFVKTSS